MAEAPHDNVCGWRGLVLGYWLLIGRTPTPALQRKAINNCEQIKPFFLPWVLAWALSSLARSNSFLSSSSLDRAHARMLRTISNRKGRSTRTKDKPSLKPTRPNILSSQTLNNQNLLWLLPLIPFSLSSLENRAMQKITDFLMLLERSVAHITLMLRFKWDVIRLDVYQISLSSHRISDTWYFLTIFSTLLFCIFSTRNDVCYFGFG